MKQKTWTPTELQGYAQWYEDGVEYLQTGTFYSTMQWNNAVNEIQWPAAADMTTLEQYRLIEAHLIGATILPDPFEGLDFIDEL